MGRFRAPAPARALDMPAEFHTRIYEPCRNRETAIFRSKAVGEPPLNLGIAVFQAIKDAVAAFGTSGCSPSLDAPATPERVLMAIERLRERPEPAIHAPAAPKLVEAEAAD